ncbi:MAG: adenylate/guanylate cyclase domain-containing protein [Oscillospiraceae bacterium]
MEKKSFAKKIFVALLVALLFMVLYFSKILLRLDNILCDALYQSPQSLEGNIALIGIDRRTLEQLGPFNTWTREVLANAISALNANEASRPAAIGIDAAFVGNTVPTADAALVKAAGQYDNVVVASMAQFGSKVITKADGSFYMDKAAVLALDEPYDALKAVTHQGHINAMYDTDGILRQNLFSILQPNGEALPSFSYQLYMMYCEANGIEPNMPPVNDSGYWFVPFKGAPGAYDEGLSLCDLINGDLDSDLFADKIVLIGPYAAGMQDAYVTSIDHAKPMYGVEYQANVIDTLIAGDFKQQVPSYLQVILLFGVAIISVLFFWNRRMLTATIALMLSAGGYVAICIAMYNSGFIMDALYVPMCIICVYIASLAANYVREAIAKRRIQSTFSRYVAPEIVQEILREGKDSLNLGGKLTDIAVLFVDIRGFTTMSEALPPETVVEILNKYLTLTSTCILNNAGTLDKFVGDATMAFWGAPLPQDDCIYKAVKTALDMVEGSVKLSEELQERFGRTVSFGIGVHYGSAVVGNIGSPSRMDYTAIGDTVNTSARLEANAPGGTVLVSRVVADALQDRVCFTSLGDTIKLKGKAEGFEILKVDGLKER